MKNSVEIPKEVDLKLDDGHVSVEGSKGKVEKDFFHPLVKIIKDGNKVVVSTDSRRKKIKAFINTFSSKIKSMVIGVQDPFEYKLKVCSSHFPMNVSAKNNVLTIKNYLGEKHPRDIKISSNVDIRVNKDVITLSSPDKELVGSQAGVIEGKVRVFGKDRRKFQDGIYIIEKAGKKIV